MVRAEQVPYDSVKLWALSTLYLMHHPPKPAWARVSLTVDEADRLRRRLHSGDLGCDLDFQIFGRITTRSSTNAKDCGSIIVLEPVACVMPSASSNALGPAGAAGDDALARYDDNRNGAITCKEARRHGIAPVPRSHPAYRHMRDADGDGVVCE